MKKISIFLLIVSSSAAINVFAQFVPEWTQIYNFTSNFTYYPAGITFDQANNVYLTGFQYLSPSNPSTVTRKFDSNGLLQWTKTYYGDQADSSSQPISLFPMSNGDVIVVGNVQDPVGNDGAVFLVRYSSIGSTINEVAYRNPGSNFTKVFSAQVDGNSNIYVTGRTSNNQVYRDSIFTAKFNQNFVLQWYRTFGSTFQFGVGVGRSLKIDATGNAYVTGETSVTNYERDIATLKYSSSGGLAWVQTYRFNNSAVDDRGLDVILDASQNVIVSGTNRVVNGNDTGHTSVLKYDNNGQLQWANSYDLTNSGIEEGEKILTENNNLYIHIITALGYRLLKLNSSGIQQWVYLYLNNPAAIGFDLNNKIYSAGYQVINSKSLLSINWINLNGTTDNSCYYSYNGTGGDAASGIKFLGSSNMMITGNHFSSFIIVKMLPSSSNTINLSKHALNKPIADSSYTYDTINISVYNLPVNSTVKDVNITIDSLLHSADGDLEIALIHNGVTDTLVYRRGGPFDNFIGTVLDDTASINICNGGLPPYTGYFAPCLPLSNYNFLQASGQWILRIYDRRAPDTGVLKAWSISLTYNVPIGINQISTEAPRQFVLSQNYPNPFNPSTKIQFQIPLLRGVDAEGKRGVFTKLIIYDVLGREITTLVNESLKPGTYEVEWDATNYPSGVYFYRITASDFNETKKLILLK